MTNANSIDNTRAARVALAQTLVANAANKTAAAVDVEKQKQLEELKAATMPNPFTGKAVKCMYFGEIFPSRGFTLADYIEAQYVTRAEYDAVVAELDQLKSGKKAPAIK